MAVLNGVKEKVHWGVYDCVKVDPRKQLRDVTRSSTLKFFVDVQDKTKLETNLQSASLLPHYNTFEARAMRVIISDLPPRFADEQTVRVPDLSVLDAQGNEIANATATLDSSVERLMQLLQEARDSDEGSTTVPFDDEDVVDADPANVAGVDVDVPADAIEAALEGEEVGPPREQIRYHDGAGTIIGKLIYNTVTTFFVGEKVMISMPTFYFPSGAGPFSETGRFTSHGEPSPVATFKFAEPVYVDKNQNFRVEIEIPENETFREIQKIYGPLFIWVSLEGFLTRDVQ